MLAPGTQSVLNVWRCGQPPVEQSVDHSKLETPFELTHRRLESKRRPLRRAIPIFQAASCDPRLWMGKNPARRLHNFFDAPTL
jgi:hypothetical protein